MRVLVVEDEPHIAEAVTFLLEREGHQVTVVASGNWKSARTRERVA